MAIASLTSLMRATIISTGISAVPLLAFSEVNDVSHRLSDDQLVAPLESFQECPVCPAMIALPMGSFMMGATPEESRNPLDIFGPNPSFLRRGPEQLNIIPQEHPRHLVEIDIPFAMGRNEVTFAEWKFCVEDGGCVDLSDNQVATPSGRVTLGPTHPVMDISYLDILDYVGWLNAQVGAEVYRLPTEAEWEYAARAGTETRFAQGDDLTANEANFSRGGTEQLRGTQMPGLIDRFLPVRVEELDAANGWRLRHMSGNISELTQSCWSREHLGLTSSSAYLANAESQDSCRRVVKGGSYSTAMDYLRPSKRGSAAETTSHDGLGFRVLRQLDNRE